MFNLRIQVFIAFVSFAVLLTFGLFFYSKLSFEHSFSDYMEQKEKGRNARLLIALAAHYEVRGNWQALASTEDWDEFTAKYSRFNRNFDFPKNGDQDRPPHDHDRPDTDSPDDERANNTLTEAEALQAKKIRKREAKYKKEEHQRENLFKDMGRLPSMPPPSMRFLLLDADENLIAGEKFEKDNYLLTKIYASVNHKQILCGYLGTPVNPALQDFFDTQFVKRQQNHFLLMALVGLFIAALCAIPLSHLLTQRVKTLARYVQQLSLGNYAERIATSGQDEITTLAKHLNHLSYTLDQSEQTRKRWVADISHELRTPLAVLQADLEAFEDGVRKLDQQAIARLQKHAARLTRLVNDLYELSLTDIGALSYRKQECDLNELIADIGHSLEGKFAQAGLNFTFKKSTAEIYILADPQRLQQLLLNLLNNSINYTNSPGTVNLSLTKNADQAIVVIEDSAPGVAPDDHEKLFERLYRAESSRSRETGGAGLGLSICRNIVEAHKGSINIGDSSLGGLKVTLTLPLLIE